MSYTRLRLALSAVLAGAIFVLASSLGVDLAHPNTIRAQANTSGYAIAVEVSPGITPLPETCVTGRWVITDLETAAQSTGESAVCGKRNALSLTLPDGTTTQLQFPSVESLRSPDQRNRLLAIGLLVGLLIIIWQDLTRIRAWMSATSHRTRIAPRDFLDNPARSLWQDVRQERRALLWVALGAGVFQAVLWIAWPLYDDALKCWRTVGYYQDVFATPDLDLVLYNLVAYQPPLSPLFYGFLLTHLGTALTSLILFALAIISAWAVYLIGRTWSRTTGYLTVAGYLLSLHSQLLFHYCNLEMLTMVCFIFSLLALLYGLQSRRLAYFVVFGLCVGLMSLSRPANIGFVGAAILILLLDLPLRRKLIMGAVVGLVTVATVAPWIVYKGTHWGLWSYTRGSAWAGFFHVAEGHLIYADNGPASQQLADLTQTYLVPQFPEGTTVDTILRYPGSPESRLGAVPVFDSFVFLVDTVEGWDTDYALLGAVAQEASAAYPVENALEFLRDAFLVLWANESVTISIPALPLQAERSADHRSFFSSHPNDVEFNAADYNALVARTAAVVNPLRTERGSFALRQFIGVLTRDFWLPSWIFYSLALLGLVTNRGKSLYCVALLAFMIVVLVAFSSLAGDLPRYRWPTEVFFVLLACLGLQRLITLMPLGPPQNSLPDNRAHHP